MGEPWEGGNGFISATWTTNDSAIKINVSHIAGVTVINNETVIHMDFTNHNGWPFAYHVRETFSDITGRIQTVLTFGPK
jgi:hypothetical protein